MGIGTTGGLLLSGIGVSALGSLQAEHTELGIRAFLIELGLVLFIMTIGLETGPNFFQQLRQSGWFIIGMGSLLTGLPMIVGYLWARAALRQDPVWSLGAITGAMTSTPALTVLIQETQSLRPVQSYAGTYAIANLILTLIGTWGMQIQLVP